MALFTLRAPASLNLPPAFRSVGLRESGDAFAHARRIAVEEGAGTLVWVRRFDIAEFAVVLEPGKPLGEARKTFFLGMNALLQAIAAHCPPERSITFDWPDAIRFDGGLVGGGRLAWPKHCAEDEVPEWLVFAGTVRVAFSGLTEPGHAPNAAALEDEGFEGTGPSAIVESFARFLLRQVDIWQASGFDPIVASYLEHLEKERAGDTLSLTQAGDLVIRSAAGPAERSLPLLQALRAVAWLDPDTGEPKL